MSEFKCPVCGATLIMTAEKDLVRVSEKGSLEEIRELFPKDMRSARA